MALTWLRQVNSLHKTLKSLLGAVVRFLRDLLENKEDTKMGAENLGIVFGPLLIPQNLEAQNSLELISRTSAASTVLQLMCANYQQLFVVCFFNARTSCIRCARSTLRFIHCFVGEQSKASRNGASVECV